MMAIYLSYVPLTFLGYYALGYFPYAFISWDTWYSYFMLIVLGLLQLACYFGVALLNNRLKRRYLQGLADKESNNNLDRGLYNEVQMNMFKSTINNNDLEGKQGSKVIDSSTK